MNLLSIILTAVMMVGCQRDAQPPVHVREFQSSAIHLDKVYRSMAGPKEEQLVTLGSPGERAPVWITGVEVDPLDGAGQQFDGQEFVCHVNVSWADREVWARQLAARQQEGRSLPFNWFTLVQGHYAIAFPEGFGVPATTDQSFRILSMAQMQDASRKPFDMRIRSRVKFVYDRDLTTPMTPLAKFSWDVRVASAYKGPHGGAHCENDDDSKGASAVPAASDAVLHFAVAPGRQEFRAEFDGSSKLPFDTMAHHISAHLHVYGQSLELRDLTTGASLFTSHATANPRHTGIAEMTNWVSPAGLALYRDHRYELKAVYENPTDEIIDGMAVLYVYYRDVPPAAGMVKLN